MYISSVKLAAFMIIQTFFVTALSSSLMQELRRLLETPGEIVSLLATSLPGKSTFFIQLCFVSTTTTFINEGIGILRLGKAWLRKYVGPNLTDRERKMPVFGE